MELWTSFFFFFWGHYNEDFSVELTNVVTVKYD
jgi:hypothetical protein